VLISQPTEASKACKSHLARVYTELRTKTKRLPLAKVANHIFNVSRLSPA